MAGLVPADDLPDAVRMVPAEDMPTAMAQPVAPAAPVARPTRTQLLQEGMQRQYSIADNIGGAIAEPVVSAVTGMAGSAVGGLAGIGQGIKNLVSPGMPAADRVAQVQEALTYQPRTTAGKATTAAVNVPLSYIEKGADYLGGGAANLTSSPAIGAGVKAGVEFLPSLLLRGRVSRGSTGPNRPGAPAAAPEVPANPAAAAKAERSPGLASLSEKPPSLDELKAQAKAAYKRADEAGIRISGNSLNGLKSRIVSDLKKEGIDKTLHPSTTAALKRITETKGDISLSELETLRKIAKDAEKSTAPADVRLAATIVDRIDTYVERLGSRDITSGDPANAAALKEARGLYSRQKKAEEIQTLFDRAELSAPNYSASGMENALRIEFRALAKNERKMRRFTPEERSAIKKVALGGPMENLMRQVGKFAPTGAVSTGVSLAATAVGGPAALLLPAAGIGGRFVAKKMTMKNANAAEELMRRGPIKNKLVRDKTSQAAQ